MGRILQSMKVHHFARGFNWEQENTSLSLGCKRLRTLAPKHSSTATAAANTTNFDLKSFIRPESGPRKTASSDYQKKESPQLVESQPAGGTRWNPTQEQIGILEMLYRGGMRTPNAQQIEQITEQLSKYGKIEGKNVFYWFQNHKARERQKQKRNSLGLSHSPRTPPATSPFSNHACLLLPTTKGGGGEEELEGPYKRTCRSWPFDQCVEEDNRFFTEEDGAEDRTLKLFPLHPEGRM